MMTKNKTAAKKTEDQSVVYKVPAAFVLMIVVIYAFWKLGGYYSTVEGFTALYPMFCVQRYVFLALTAAELVLCVLLKNGLARTICRYWLAAFALPYLPARRAAAQPAGLQDTNKPLGVCMALAGAALLVSGVAAGNTARYAILYPEVLSGSCPVWAAWADLLLPIFAGAWLLNYAVRAFSGFGLQRQRLGSSLLAGAVPLVFLWRLIWRFQFAPASLCRMPCTLRVLSAAAALLLAVVLIKIFLVPGLPCGHTLYAAGTGAFLLCTGLELPQTLFEAARGMLTLPDLLTGIGIGLFGLCGLVCAWEACGKETE